MSRRLTPGRDARRIGWDRPLGSFFGQVYDPRLGEGANPVFWIGADRPGQVPELADLVVAMAPYAHLPPALLATLQHDRETEW